jgi:hypothetical protein
MNKHALEVIHIGGEKLMSVVRKEFEKDFYIVARTPEYIVLSNSAKSVSFCRLKNRVIERHTFDSSRGITRK